MRANNKVWVTLPVAAKIKISRHENCDLNRRYAAAVTTCLLKQGVI